MLTKINTGEGVTVVPSSLRHRSHKRQKNASGSERACCWLRFFEVLSLFNLGTVVRWYCFVNVFTVF